MSKVVAMEGLPASVQTEVTVLGAMLLDAVAVADATARLVAEDFLLDSHQRIYKVMRQMVEAGEHPDLITVMDALQQRHELDAIGGATYLSYLTEGIPRRPNIESYVRIVKDKSLLRQVMAACEATMAAAADQGESSAQEVLASHEARLGEIAGRSIERGFADVSGIVQESFGSIDALYEQGREVTGLRTRYHEFDKMTSGLQESELVIIAARPSMGKTAWALNIAQNAAVKDGKVVAVFSLEMSREALLRRMLAAEAMVGTRKLQTGFIPRADKEGLIAALDRLMASRLYIDDTPAISLLEMRAKARRLRMQEGELDLIVVDYLQLMTAGGVGRRGPENRTQEVSAISRGLKALAKELRVPVVALSQLSRNSEQRAGDKRPLLSDLRESGSIEQDADVVAFIHREEYYDRDNEEVKGQAEVIVAKQRNGPTGTVRLAYLAEYTRFENLETNY